MLANDQLNLGPALAGAVVWFATKEPASNCDEVLSGVKYAFMDPVTKPFPHASFAYTLLFQCVDTLYFSRKLK